MSADEEGASDVPPWYLILLNRQKKILGKENKMESERREKKEKKENKEKKRNRKK